MVINGRYYSKDNLDHLPQEIKLSEIKMREEGNTFGFQGRLAPTAPNTMICCTVYTKRVRKNNTSTYTNLSLKHCIIKCALYQHYAVFEY